MDLTTPLGHGSMPSTDCTYTGARVDAIRTAKIITARIMVGRVGYSGWGILAGRVHTGGVNSRVNNTVMLTRLRGLGILARAQHTDGENGALANACRYRQREVGVLFSPGLDIHPAQMSRSPDSLLFQQDG
jgi:hypothetical protein